VLARAGRQVTVLEAQPTIGGGCRSAELTLPGFVHDRCSAIHPMSRLSPFLQQLPLERYGAHYIHPSAPMAHPLDDGSAMVLERSIQRTAERLGSDARAYSRLIAPFATRAIDLLGDALGPLHIPRDPLLLMRFGLLAIRSSHALSTSVFRGERARALFAGMAAHAVRPLTETATAAFGLIFAVLGHAVGWPLVRGGSQRLVDALVAALSERGGTVLPNRRVDTMRDLPPAGVALFDVTPRQLVEIAADRLPARYLRQLQRFRYGPGIFKVDYALDGPVPWRDPECLRAGTVHLGGTQAEIEAAEAMVWRDQHPRRPFVIVAQQSLFDETRAPPGKHTLWAYCHVPSGSKVDMTERIEAQIERFAPGFTDRVLARATMSSADVERDNANYIAGDISAGVHDVVQLIARPAPRLVPYSTPDPGIYLCSASTPPGAGVHGLCGVFAARAVLRRT
jgi:phytoene dehydrogenase-like protein